MEGLVSLIVLLLILYLILKNIWEILGVAASIAVGLIGLIIVYIIWTRVLHFNIPDALDFENEITSNIDEYIDSKDKEYNSFIYKDVEPKEGVTRYDNLPRRELEKYTDKDEEIEAKFGELTDETDVEGLMENLTDPEYEGDTEDDKGEPDEDGKELEEGKKKLKEEKEQKDEPSGIMKYIKVPQYGEE